MAKKRKKSSSKRSNSSDVSIWDGLDIDPETQRGILSIIFLTIGLVIGFSLVGLAGDVGAVINAILSAVVGIGRYIIPLVFFILVYRLLYPTDNEITPLYITGLVLFTISAFGLIDVIQIEAGGFVGTVITYLFREFASIAVAVVVLLAMFIISVLILFNTSLEHLAQYIPASSAIGRTFRFILSMFSSARDRIAVARDQAIAELEEARREAAENAVLEDDEDEYEDDEFVDEDEASFDVREIEEDDMMEEDDEESDEDIADDIASGKGTSKIHLAKKHRKIDLPLDLLSGKSSKPTSGDIEENKEIILQTLANFGVEVEMGPVSVGPTVTQYTFKPSKGVKVSQVLSLQNDLALALAAHPIRVEAPIPGKSLIGIEVPNVTAARVGLRELLDSAEFKERDSNLAVPFGRNVGGEVAMDNLNTMPHLLVAGATGSGKSVCMNTVILSLLYQNGPDDLKLIMVDPKRVEFTMYNDIPHLLTPVITDVQKTINALKWTVNEMDRRYEVLSQARNRDIASYNEQHPDATMPYIVFMVDELADLMATAPREVEAAIVRLAQMARAVGIHLVLATQRPSVDVITGLIKANITARCAFNVASLVDSRTILDNAGAEKLLGKGDMLYINSSSPKPRRIQGAFISEKEVKQVVGYLRSQAKADYDDEIINAQSVSSLPQAFNDSSDEDDLLPKAKEVIMSSQKASASLLQRRLRIGYARAARILDILEEQGIIGPSNGAKPREILVTEDDLEQQSPESAGISTANTHDPDMDDFSAGSAIVSEEEIDDDVILDDDIEIEIDDSDDDDKF